MSKGQSMYSGKKSTGKTCTTTVIIYSVIISLYPVTYFGVKITRKKLSNYIVPQGKLYHFQEGGTNIFNEDSSLSQIVLLSIIVHLISSVEFITITTTILSCFSAQNFSIQLIDCHRIEHTKSCIRCH